MSIPFDRLGLWFKLFSALFYPRSAKQHLFNFIRTVEPGSLVIDLGGGTGILLDFAHRVRADLTYLCVDPALGMLKYVGQYGYRVAARGEYLPFMDCMVGAVMIGDAVHHFIEPDRAIEEVRRTLKPGGKLFIFDINPQTFVGGIVVALERLLREPVNFYSPEQLQDLLAGNGFTVLDKGHGWRYTLEAEKQSSPVSSSF
jgi:ubiquinone/menaquinone biosynthesis C-methylase UbiE